MGLRNLLYLVGRNLRRMKLRVAMTSIGVLIGTTAIILLVSLGAGLQRAMQTNLLGMGDLTEIRVIVPRGPAFGVGVSDLPEENVRLDEQALRNFREMPGVEAVTPLVYMQSPARLQFNRMETYGNIIGIDPREIDQLDMKMESGIARLGQWQCIIGHQVMSNFRNPMTGARPEQTVELQGEVLELVVMRFLENAETTSRVVRLRVVGVLEQSGGERDYSVYLSLNDMLDLNAWALGQRPNLRSEGYEQVMVKTGTTQQVTPVEQEIARRGFVTYSAQTNVRSLNQFFMIFQLALGGIGGIALLVAGFGIANAMIMAIYERTREIGLMKAVGARSRDVMFVFLAEAGFIGMVGGVGGVLVGWLVGLVANLIAGAYIQSLLAQSGGFGTELPSLVYTPVWLVLFAILFSGLVGVISGIYPAMRATNLDPISALRYE